MKKNNILWENTYNMDKKTISRKLPLLRDNLLQVVDQLNTNSSYDNVLFIFLLLTRFYGPLCLRELCQPDSMDLKTNWKVIKYLSVRVFANCFKFLLPSQKSDTYFEGNKVVILQTPHAADPYKYFVLYFNNRNRKFPSRRELWLTESGEQPTCAFFISKLRSFFLTSIAGQLMCAGGATFLAKSGIALHLIQAAGKWSSKAFHYYIWKSPILIHAMASCHSISTA